MKTNDTFSFPRVGTLIKSDFMENWRTHLLHALALCAAFLLFFFHSVVRENGNAYYYHFFRFYAKNTLSMCIVISILYFFLTTSGMTTHLRDKSERIRYLMIPAGMNEKFTSRLLYLCSTAIAILLSAFLLADLTQYFLFPLCGFKEENPVVGQLYTIELVKHFSSIPAIRWKVNDFYESWPWIGTAMTLVLYCWQHSLFILGGCIWNRYAALKTVCTQLIIYIVGGYMLWLLLTNCEFPDNVYEFIGWIGEMYDLTYDHWIMLCILFFAGCTLLNWRLAYRLYSRTQVIPPKLFAK